MNKEFTGVGPDVSVTDHGTLFLFQTYTPAVRQWFDIHTDAPRLADAYAVEHRYAGDIVNALQAEGFTVV
jgi:hypothetical protein